LVFLGVSALPSWLQLPASEDVRARIHLHPRVAPRQVVRYARGADAAMVTTAASSESHRLALPNKLFEGIQAHLPVIATDLPEIGRVIQLYDCGLLFVDGSPESLRGAMNELMDNKELSSRLKAGA